MDPCIAAGKSDEFQIWGRKDRGLHPGNEALITFFTPKKRGVEGKYKKRPARRRVLHFLLMDLLLCKFLNGCFTVSFHHFYEIKAIFQV